MGLAGFGKNFVASNLEERLGDLSVSLSFASTMKDIINKAVAESFSKQVFAQSNLSPKDDTGMYSNEDFEEIKNNTDIVIPLNSNQITIRSMLQNVGTDVIRSIFPDFHVKMTAKNVLESNKPIVFITDGRFENEISFVANLNEKSTAKEQQNYLVEVSSFNSPNLVTQMKELEERINKAFGLNSFSESLLKYFLENLPSSKTDINLPNEQPNAQTKPYAYPTSFNKALTSGVLLVNRSSKDELRKLDTTHSSEKYTQELIDYLKSTKTEEDLSSVLFNNSSDAGSNPQFAASVGIILQKMFMNLVQEGIIDEPLEIENPTRIPSLEFIRKFLSTVSTTGEVRGLKKAINRLPQFQPTKTQINEPTPTLPNSK
jgi:hypothetical protein